MAIKTNICIISPPQAQRLLMMSLQNIKPLCQSMVVSINIRQVFVIYFNFIINTLFISTKIFVFNGFEFAAAFELGNAAIDFVQKLGVLLSKQNNLL